MTFNEGMQIDTSTTSSSGGGRGPGRGIAIGGGLGGLLIITPRGGQPIKLECRVGRAREFVAAFVGTAARTGATAGSAA